MSVSSMASQNQLVSVIVPFYNAEAFLELAIQSVLNQSYTNWELILVNDGSTDKSESIANVYVDNRKIVLLNHPNRENRGVSLSRALAIKASRGDFISFLDADDHYEIHKIEKNINTLKNNPDVILVHSCANFIDRSKKNPHRFFNEFKFEKINKPYSFFDGDFLNSNPICNSSVTVRSKYLKKINNSFQHLFQYEDWINWILLAQFGDFYYLNEPLCNYGFHDESSTSFLLNNPIRFLYAKLEMLFILYPRIENTQIKDKIEIELNHHLGKIYSFYEKTTGKYPMDGNRSNPISSRRLKIFNKFMKYLKK